MLNKLAAISSDAVYTYERLLQIDMEQENWQQVVDNANRYLAVYPLLAKVYSHLGRANEELGRDDQAIDSYRRLLLLDPADPAEVHSDAASAKGPRRRKEARP